VGCAVLPVLMQGSLFCVSGDTGTCLCLRMRSMFLTHAARCTQVLPGILLVDSGFMLVVLLLSVLWPYCNDSSDLHIESIDSFSNPPDTQMGC
jgi:hypothetical protein